MEPGDGGGGGRWGENQAEWGKCISTSNLYEYMVCRKYVNNSDSEQVNSTYKVVQFL